MVPVSGAIEFAGRDRPGVCRVSFVPEASQGPIRPRGGTMGSDGAYQLTEYLGVRGLTPGTYRIRLTYYDLKPGGDAANESDWIGNEYESSETLTIEPGMHSVTHNIVVSGE
ncbi:hypothetical protein [Pseudobythopirellula maris]|uniref:hypothetical protein n=1 Tax=Pseudobythopirellula maris TaxID=2527991 RepID=UPI0011B3C6B5|nr:hypothetical protein [Pseudobythopirellula maris]